MAQFSQTDIEQIQSHGLSLSDVDMQISDFKRGFPFASIISAATINNGIFPMLSDEYAKYYESVQNNYKITKFVPASGAATRMSKDLFEFLETNNINKITQTTLDNLKDFAFYDELIQILPTNASDKVIIEHIITETGLNYGNLPKGLITFHKYQTETRSAIAEHLVEGAQYASSNGETNIHFTVSPEHIDGFLKHLDKIIPIYQSRYGTQYNISISTQKSETDTIAVNPDNTPFRNDDNTLLFRPAGHGALIKNLNEIDSDIIFIKNIDNVCNDQLRNDTILHKRALAGLAIKIQKQIFEHQTALDNGTADIIQIRNFIEQNLGIRKFADSDIAKILNRPLRICGMIRNTGAPGGGPFWIKEKDGTETLQIVESSQISPDQKHIMTNGEYFNPVDLICMPYDYKGNKFNLDDFIDYSAGFISEKSKNGRPLRAMERPGLWNGAMAYWNSVFVEIPASTFTPAKTIIDLLGYGHK